MPLTKRGKLSQCLVQTNCILVENRFSNVNLAYTKLVEIAISLPRTSVIINTNTYWHGICRSLIFRFPDDLEILKLQKERIIQIRSASRFGASDLGVNRKRVYSLFNKLMQIDKDI